MTYEERVQAFARAYRKEYGLSQFANDFGLKITTASDGLQREGGFARRTHKKVARVIEDKIREAHSMGRPLEFNGIPLPVSDELKRELYGELPEPASARGDEPAEPETASDGLDGQAEATESANSADVTQDETPSVEGEPGPSETDPIFVPEGVSVLDPALWEDGPATESAEYHDPERTAEDMRRIFGVDGGGISGQNKGADPWYGWLGPSPPQGVTLDSPSIRDEITRLTTQWHRYLTALQVYNEIEDKNSANMRSRLLQLSYRLELILVRDHYMTPPSKDIPMEDIERRVEIERLKFFIVPEPSHGGLGTLLRSFTNLPKWLMGRGD